jgi:hypothetical protein
MNIYKRIIVVVSGALFILLVLLAAIITDLNDRDFPQAIGSESRLNITFNESAYSITEAFSKLVELNTRLDLGLVKIAPDLASDGDGKIFVTLNEEEDLPDEITGFNGDNKVEIMANIALPILIPMGSTSLLAILLI